MVTKIMQWVSITTLLLVVSWRPFANYQLRLDFVGCVSAFLAVLAFFSIRRRVLTRNVFANGSDAAKQFTDRR